MENKEKIIKLFNSFIENKEIPLHKGYKHYIDKEVNCGYVDESSYNNYPYSENAYFIDGDRVYESEKLKYDFCFKPLGKKLLSFRKEVTLFFSELPNVVLAEEYRPVEKLSEKIDEVSRNGIRRYTKKKVTLFYQQYTTEVVRTISFGKIIIELSEEEFNTLYTKAQETLKVRAAEIEGILLDKRLEEYCS